MIWNLLIIYISVTIINFLKNAYRMIHTAYLNNTLLKNIKQQTPEKNYELYIPIKNVFNKANVYVSDIESELQHWYLTPEFTKSFHKAYYHYKYLMKHCFTWFLRIPFPKFKFVKSEKINALIKTLFFCISTIAVYLLETYLNQSGLGLQILNSLTDFLNSLF